MAKEIEKISLVELRQREEEGLKVIKNKRTGWRGYRVLLVILLSELDKEMVCHRYYAYNKDLESWRLTVDKRTFNFNEASGWWEGHMTGGPEWTDNMDQDILDMTT